MAKFCPEINQKVLYLTCLECKTKTCLKQIEENNKNNINIKEKKI